MGPKGCHCRCDRSDSDDFTPLAHVLSRWEMVMRACGCGLWAKDRSRKTGIRVIVARVIVALDCISSAYCWFRQWHKLWSWLQSMFCQFECWTNVKLVLKFAVEGLVHGCHVAWKTVAWWYLMWQYYLMTLFGLCLRKPHSSPVGELIWYIFWWFYWYLWFLSVSWTVDKNC